MIELSTIRDLVAIFGVIAGFSYYVLTVRNANRARKIQLMMDIRDRMLDRDYLIDSVEVMELEWEDFDDFMRKHGSNADKESYVKRFAVWIFFEGLGYQLHKGLIDIEDHKLFQQRVHLRCDGIGAGADKKADYIFEIKNDFIFFS